MLVRDHMSSPAVTIGPRVSLQEARNIMQEKGLQRLPVLEDGKLVGIIVYHDVEKALRSPGKFPATPVEWVMTKPVYWIEVDAPLVKAARMLREYRISCLPVLKEGQVVGVVAETDIINAFIELLEGKTPEAG